MRSSSETCGRSVLVRLAAVGLVSAAVAGCSADATRFTADAGGAGGYGGQPSPEVTGSLRPQGTSDTVVATQLPPPSGYSQSGYPQNGYGAGQASYGAPASYAASGPGQPLYGSPAYNSGASAPAGQGTHVVQAGETLESVARTYGIPAAQLGAANNIAPGMTVRTGQALVIPPRGSYTQPAPHATAALPPQKPTHVAAAPLPAPAKPATEEAAKASAASTKVAAAPTAPVQKVSAPAASAVKVETAANVSAAVDDDAGPRTPGSGPQFRAPVRGRVIATFGPKPGGTHNDGVNFAVPEGTAVRAAEDGTVAYAGNELKGYGNLVLIKHADGFVTAYAHNSELMVKRGDQVRRGQIVAKAGQSGNVTTPQLHFEIRKGTQAVDPSRYVAGL